ncbi:DMT family transporter [Devosia sp. ZB163]|uniref:DMT family transporter n=1 Tax=Devosia sp. ZB163 TaxID=3025938 RepID=UPI0023623EEA|nr:DMT family transporter [Devosia sp. ZB163]MDC9824444.1 DMT family transporter [Devosia sp. ZB163]
MSPTSLGVLTALTAYAVYSIADAMVKGLGGELSVFEIGFFTTLFSVIPALFSKPADERWRDTFKLRRPWLMGLIAVCRTASAMLITYSFVTIPLAEAYSLVFLIPVMTIVLSVVVLRERVGLERWALAIISFVGVLIVVRPGFKEIELGHITAFGCAISAAISVTAMRLISGEERKVTLFALPGLLTLIANAIGLVIFGAIWPGWMLLGGLLVCGVLGGIGYLLQIAAVTLAPASRVAPMQYSQIVWALLFGALFFEEAPDAVGLVGLTLVVAAGIGNIFIDGARARIAGRWAEYRARRDQPEPSGFDGPGPDPV